MAHARRMIVPALAVLGFLTLGLLGSCSLPTKRSAHDVASAFIGAARRGDTAGMCSQITPYSQRHIKGGCASLRKVYLDLITDKGHPSYRQGEKAAPPGSRAHLRLNYLEAHDTTAGGQVSAAYPADGRVASIFLVRVNGFWKVDLFHQGPFTSVIQCQYEQTTLIGARAHYIAITGHLPTNIEQLIQMGFLSMRSLHVDLLPNGTVSAVHDCA